MLWLGIFRRPKSGATLGKLAFSCIFGGGRFSRSSGLPREPVLSCDQCAPLKIFTETMRQLSDQEPEKVQKEEKIKSIDSQLKHSQ